MSSMKDVIEELKRSITRLESAVDDLESEVAEQEEGESIELPFADMNVLIGHGLIPGAVIEIDGERRYVFEGFVEGNHDILAQFKILSDDEDKDKIVKQDLASLLDRQNRWKIVKDQE